MSKSLLNRNIILFYNIGFICINHNVISCKIFQHAFLNKLFSRCLNDKTLFFGPLAPHKHYVGFRYAAPLTEDTLVEIEK